MGYEFVDGRRGTVAGYDLGAGESVRVGVLALADDAPKSTVRQRGESGLELAHAHRAALSAHGLRA